MKFDIGKVFGKMIDVESLVKGVATELADDVAEPILKEFFEDRCTAERRVDLGKALVKAGNELQSGHYGQAARTLAKELNEVKF